MADEPMGIRMIDSSNCVDDPVLTWWKPRLFLHPTIVMVWLILFKRCTEAAPLHSVR